MCSLCCLLYKTQHLNKLCHVIVTQKVDHLCITCGSAIIHREEGVLSVVYYPTSWLQPLTVIVVPPPDVLPIYGLTTNRLGRLGQPYSVHVRHQPRLPWQRRQKERNQQMLSSSHNACNEPCHHHTTHAANHVIITQRMQQTMSSSHNARNEPCHHHTTHTTNHVIITQRMQRTTSSSRNESYVIITQRLKSTMVSSHNARNKPCHHRPTNHIIITQRTMSSSHIVRKEYWHHQTTLAQKDRPLDRS